MEVFGERLKAFREAAGRSQPELAAYSGVPVGTIRDYEQGRRAPLLETAAKLAHALQQPLEAFLSSDTPKTNAPKRRGKRKDR
jgi:transcriptional regulator with XRE-family HTH domain